MKEKKADIITVALTAGVSASTVSRFFNHPDLLKPTTRFRINEAVKETGYIRNRAAQTIHGIRSGTIGLIVPTIDHAIFAELVQSFSQSVDEKGFTILLASHGYDLDREYALARKMLEHRVDGIALIGLDHADETYLLIERQRTPTILLWNYAQDTKLPCVGSDNFAAGYQVGRHVVELGHRRIASVFPPLTGNDRAAHRYEGFRAALKEAAVDIAPEWMLETPYSVAAAKSAVDILLSGASRLPTALVCGNDVLAWGALHAASQLDIAVPEQLTVTGIGDFKGSKEFEPALTTVRIPANQIGRKGAEAIVQSVTTPEDPCLSELIAPELLCRQTSAQPR